ncbi:SusC/RagA family TonB-linked outer membrane protein [Pedobacter sp. SYP-B3415]|uniref:SusC/RagA family TonB-linked outer membrane protein n=1 Tax=Pedobacter sp. SYP-B3415 TaxID=2496641 RepID=UPI00101B7898|nr:SusC/RagA family TonB-linked outer membrane protein [Pedobacter sp. SYP-B3415]
MRQIFTKLIKNTLAALLLLSWTLLATNHAKAQGFASATGLVRDTTGNPIIGVTVKAEDTQTGKSVNTVTNNEGIFNFPRLQPAGNYNFTFTYIGYITKSLNGYDAQPGAKISLSVVLRESATALSQVVVTGYGRSSRSELTGAVTSVQADEFNRGVVSSPAQLLQGKVAGLNITRSGNPNDAGTAILRGPSTLRDGAQQPFYVIDGVPGASIDLLAPDDIMSIDVLKDASSAAIYGSRAANGVIMVTTKRAKEGQSSLSYTAYGATESVSNRIEMLSGDDLRSYLAANNRSLNATDNIPGANTDWQKEVTRTAYSQNHNLSFNGTSKQTAYNVSMNYLDNAGIIKTSSLERFILRANVDRKFFGDVLRLNISGTNSISGRQNVPDLVYQNMLTYLPTVSVKQPNGSYSEDFSRTRNYLNPVSLIDNNTLKSKTKTFLGNALAEANILTGLKYSLSISHQDEQTNNDTYYNRLSGLALNYNGYAIRNTYTNTRTILESFFNYDRNFGQHSLKLLAGYSWQQDRLNDGFQTSNRNFITDALGYYNPGLGDPPAGTVVDYNPGVTISTLRLISFYGRVNYSYNGKYLFQASLRRDGSSAFGPNKRWGYFPSVSAGWNISRENFMKGVSFVDDLKLRAAYGVSGNSLGFGPFTRILLYNTTGRFYYNGNYINAVGPSQNENADLQWEHTGMLNLGLDFTLFKNVLSGSLEVYDKRTSDLIWTYPVSTTQYFVNTLTANAGKISNKGIELMLNVRPLTRSQLKWTSSVNISHNKNNVESLSNDRFTLPYVYTAYLGGKGQSGNSSQIVREGYPVGTFNIWQYAGKNAQGVTQVQKADGTVTTSPSSNDFVYAGNAQPTLMYGWNNSFSYKNVDLSFFVRGIAGNKILNATLANLNSPLDATSVNIPRFTLDESPTDNNAYLLTDRFLESGSYLRLDNATLGYSFNFKNNAVNRLRVYATGNNLFVITKYRGIDPEINMGGLTPGIDNNNFYPKTRSFLLGLNVTF